MPELVGCPTCGYEAAAHKRFCARCGTAMPAKPAAPPPNSRPPALVGAPPTRGVATPFGAAGARPPTPAPAVPTAPVRIDMLGATLSPRACRRCGAAPVSDAPRSVLSWWGVRVDSYTGTRCRDCGIAEARSSSNRSIWMWILSGCALVALALAWTAFAHRLPVLAALGALPVLAFFAVMLFQRLFSIARLAFVLTDNASAQRRFRRLDAPRGGVAPPAPRGRPTVLRSGMLALVIVVILPSTAWLWGRSLISRPGPWVAGGCVMIVGQRAGAVDCGWRHDGRILEVVSTPGDCPVRTDRIFAVPSLGGDFACVDDGRPPRSAV